MTHPSVSVIIPNYNGRKFIVNCLKSVLATDYPNLLEVIVVDNGSTDGSVEYIKVEFSKDPRVRVIVNDKNYGPAQGYNIGAKCARGEILVFLNNDTEVDSNWLKELIETMTLHPTIGAASCKQLLLTDQKIDGLGGFLDPYGFVYPQGMLETDTDQYCKVKTVFTGGATALAVRRDIFDKIGGFDPWYFMWYEDNDLCWRIWLTGHKVIVVPSAIVYHYGSGTIRSIPKPIITYFNERNRMATLIKNYEFSTIARIFPVVLTFKLFQVIYYIVHKLPIHALMLLKALLCVLSNFKYIWLWHLKVKQFRVIPDDILIKRIMQKPNFKTIYQKAKIIYWHKDYS